MTSIDDPVMTEEATHARHWLETHGLPSGREEGWKYTPVDDIRSRLEHLPGRPSEVDLRSVARRLRWHSSRRITIVDGVHVPQLSSAELPSGVWCGTTRNLSPSVREHLTTPLTDPPDGFEALNRSASEDVLYLLVAEESAVVEPIHVVHVCTGAHAAHPRVVVDVGARSRLELIETHLSLTGGGLSNASTTIHVAAGADVVVHRIQDEDRDAFHVGRLHLIQQSVSRTDVRTFSRGAAVARLTTVIELVEPAASCRVTGLLAPRTGARHDDVAAVDHAASSCTSDLTTRSVVPEHARTSSSAHVIVRPGTVGNAVRQRADNLLLDRTAQADSRPWLEIFADDVRANHGSATGRLDEDALFYLRSRGIPLDQARQVLTRAFANTIVEQLHPASLRTHVAGWFDQEDET